MTTVLPAMIAGKIFHDGIAIGKFHGVMQPTTPKGWRMVIAHLSRNSLGTVSPKARRPCSGDELAHVDCFLDVAASLGEHLAHLAGHQARKVFLALLEQLGGAQDDRRATPATASAASRRTR